MSLKEIEAAITRLPPHDVVELSAWLTQYHAQLWDQQIEADLEAGRLDDVLSEVERECDEGLAEPL